ncbi:hypothetical protein K504DRAFT_538472 [Pleomassaria siparia CBS 279.74]|uniref:Uncharacterized protein n=1 Tax=Pleomassaria siparia CBS 279.74 TaxID=1314801 RepID=A0A6G1JU34_9PLEO|nr:hypothetical protein K504DRAFT_538472 [Pleomassaria siparia CBS 279.74]
MTSTELAMAHLSGSGTAIPLGNKTSSPTNLRYGAEGRILSVSTHVEDVDVEDVITVTQAKGGLTELAFQVCEWARDTDLEANVLRMMQHSVTALERVALQFGLEPFTPSVVQSIINQCEKLTHLSLLVEPSKQPFWTGFFPQDWAESVQSYGDVFAKAKKPTDVHFTITSPSRRALSHFATYAGKDVFIFHPVAQSLAEIWSFQGFHLTQISLTSRKDGMRMNEKWEQGANLFHRARRHRSRAYEGDQRYELDHVRVRTRDSSKTRS